MFGNLGTTEILLILLVVLLLFGAKRIPEIARGLGKGIREFKDATHDIKRELTVDDQMRLQQPQYGGTPRDQRYAHDASAHPPMPQQPYAPAAPVQPQVYGDPAATPAAPAQHPAYGGPADPHHPAYGTPPPSNG